MEKKAHSYLEYFGNFNPFYGTIVNKDSIEVVYGEKNYCLRGYLSVYKIIYSCKDGQWHKSEPIYAKILPKREKEGYEFTN